MSSLGAPVAGDREALLLRSYILLLGCRMRVNWYLPILALMLSNGGCKGQKKTAHSETVKEADKLPEKRTATDKKISGPRANDGFVYAQVRVVDEILPAALQASLAESADESTTFLRQATLAALVCRGLDGRREELLTNFENYTEDQRYYVNWMLEYGRCAQREKFCAWMESTAMQAKGELQTVLERSASEWMCTGGKRINESSLTIQFDPEDLGVGSALTILASFLAPHLDDLRFYGNLDFYTGNDSTMGELHAFAKGLHYESKGERYLHNLLELEPIIGLLNTIAHQRGVPFRLLHAYTDANEVTVTALPVVVPVNTH